MATRLFLIVLVFCIGIGFVCPNTLSVQTVVGKDDAEGDVFFSSYVSDIVVDRASNTILVVDTEAGNIKILSASGQLLKTVGGKGQGPGEYKKCTSVFVDDDSYIVSDPGLRRLQIFDRSWNLIRVIRTTGSAIADVVKNEKGILFGVTNKGFNINIVMDNNRQKYQPVFLKIGSGGEIESIGKANIHKNQFLSEMMRNIILLNGPDNSIFALYTIQNKLEIYNPSTLVKTLEIPLKFTPVKPEASMKQKGDTFFMELKMDRITTDACWGPDNKLYMTIYQGSSSKGDNEGIKVTQQISQIDHHSGKILKSWTVNGHICAFDFFSDGKIAFLDDTDGTFSVGIGELK